MLSRSEVFALGSHPKLWGRVVLKVPALRECPRGYWEPVEEPYTALALQKKGLFFFILNISLYSQLESDKSHVSVGLRFESVPRTNPLPSCYLSTHLHVPSCGRVPRSETDGMTSGPCRATKGLRTCPLPLWASFSHLQDVGWPGACFQNLADQQTLLGCS